MPRDEAKGYVDVVAAVAEFVNAIRALDQGPIWPPRGVLAMFVDRNANQQLIGGVEFTKGEPSENIRIFA